MMMFFQRLKRTGSPAGTGSAQALMTAVNRALAVIEFDMGGHVLTANENFLKVMGYQLSEIQGRHHRMFVDPSEAEGPAYQAFWDSLREGRHQVARFRRLARDGREVWIEASYNPVAGPDGQPVKIVKFATDVTKATRKAKDEEGQILAISKSQAVIEFDLDGHVLTANENFLAVTGYRLDEIQGRHHRMFVDPAEAASPAYAAFWEALREGRHQTAEYRRLAKGGREVWIQASYNPIFDHAGKPVKVVKFATDITDEKRQAAEARGQIAAIHKSQAVIEFDMDGHVLAANRNFLDVMGYELDEIQGRHHRMFVDPAEAASPAYAAFWEALREGRFQAAEYRRLAKGGSEVWIQATYNPILDMNGKPFKVVKFATDVTPRKEAFGEISASVANIQEALALISAKVTNVSAGSSQTTQNVQAVASGSEEFHASILEISRSMSQSSSEVDGALSRAGTVNEDTRRLAEAAEAMNGIVKLIQDIAGQVNLLALNATIEASRAGEAGKGFAVVANEVKVLAKQTADATSRIDTEITAIQAVAERVLAGLTGINGAMENVSSYVSGAAGAVEEQSAVTKDMSMNMQSAAEAMADINQSLAEIVAAVATVGRELETTTEATVKLTA